MQIIERKYRQLFAKGGISVNGDKDWDIQLHNAKLWRRILLHGALGLGEGYMEGWYDVKDLDEFFYRLIHFVLPQNYQSHSPYATSLALFAKFFNAQSIKRAFYVGQKHYDIGNDLYQCMLDENMNYTCGYWKNANTLKQAQINKLRLIAEKLQFKPGMKVLDIGCGFGSAMAFFAKEYEVEVCGVSISKLQVDYIKQHYADLSISVKFQDYRLVEGKFDRIYSIGMFEHVGYKNYKTYMKACRRLLNADGLMLLHTIGGNISVKNNNEWTNKYIFPNSMIPSLTQIASSSERLFVIEDVHNFGFDYRQTLLAWHKNFIDHWDKLSHYGDTFYRMWNYYLLSCSGSFRARDMQLFQIVFSPNGVKGGYNCRHIVLNKT